MGGDEAIHAVHRTDHPGAAQHLQNRHTRLISAENGGAEETRDEDMGDGHESLAERREQLQQAAAGDVHRVAGAIGRGRWTRGGRHGLAESIKSAASYPVARSHAAFLARAHRLCSTGARRRRPKAQHTTTAFMARARVFYLISSLAQGGAERHLLDLARRLDPD